MFFSKKNTTTPQPAAYGAGFERPLMASGFIQMICLYFIGLLPTVLGAQTELCVTGSNGQQITLTYNSQFDEYQGPNDESLYFVSWESPTSWVFRRNYDYFYFYETPSSVLPLGATFGYWGGSAGQVLGATVTIASGACPQPCTAPTVFPVTGGGAYCSGGAGMAIGLDNSENGMTYQLWSNGSTFGVPVNGTGTPISFGIIGTTGTYTVVATNPTGGCTAEMTGNAVVSAVNTCATITPTADACGNITMALSGALTKVRYIRLNQNANDFMNIAEVRAIEAFTGTNVALNKTVTANSTNGNFPTWHLVDDNEGSFWHSDAGGTSEFVEIDLGAEYLIDNIQITNRDNCCQNRGANLQLVFKDGTGTELYSQPINAYQGNDYGFTSNWNVVDAAWADAAAALNRANLATGTYIFLYNDLVSTPLQALPIAITAVLPTAFNITNSGLCGTSTTIGLEDSETGVNYQLQKDGGNIGAPVAGTGDAIAFGAQTDFGIYTVVATNTSSGCTANMTGNAAFSDAPAAFDVTGSGPFCSAGVGRALGLSGSEVGVAYDLYMDGSFAYSTQDGWGGALEFGETSAPGTYTIVARNSISGCTSAMIGEAVVTSTDYCITNIYLSNQQGCNGQNTSCTSDDTFIADVNIEFVAIPPTGSLVVNSDALAGPISIPVSQLSGTTHTISGVTFFSEAPNAIGASFTETAGLTYTAQYSNAGHCSNPNYYKTFQVAGLDGICQFANGTLAFAGVENDAPSFVSANNQGKLRWTGIEWEVRHAFLGARVAFAPGTPDEVPCTGWIGVENTGGYCTNTAATLTGDCDQPFSSCAITGISLANASVCNGNGTLDASDNTFTATVTVNFAYAPTSGNLTLKRGTTVLATKTAAELACVTSWTFSNATMAADGADIILTAEFDGGCTFTSASLGTTPTCLCQPVRYVKTVASGTGDGSSWADASNDLQAMINASCGGEVWVAAGTYKPATYPLGCVGCSSARDFAFAFNGGAKVYGGFAGTESAISERVPGNETIFSGDLDNDNQASAGDAYHVFYARSNMATNTLLDGVTISGGNANDEGYNPRFVNGEYYFPSQGAGIYVWKSEFTINNVKFTGNNGGAVLNYSYGFGMVISNCTFSNNTAGDGAAINTSGDGGTISNCTFTNNESDYAGAIYTSDYGLAISDCSFQGNTAYAGGAIFFSSPATVTGCTFTQNSAPYGGAVDIYESAGEITFTDCSFISNTAESGGAIYNDSDPITATDCVFSGNMATDDFAGGIFSYGGGDFTRCSFLNNSASGQGGGIYMNDNGTFLNCLFAGNTSSATNAAGGGFYNDGSNISLKNCTFANNAAPNGRGGGIVTRNGTTTLTNTILWGNTDGNADVLTKQLYKSTSGGTVNLSHTISQSGLPTGVVDGGNNSSSDPLFANAAGGDFSLSMCSPALNAGNNTGVSATDLAGATRIFGTTVDLGCYERQSAAGPAIFTALGDGTCSSEITLSGSQIGVNYQLKIGILNIGSPVAGTGSPISFGTQDLMLTFYVVATATTGGCTATMNGTPTILNPLQQDAVFENISDCQGQGTTCTSDDVFTADIVVYYTGIPTTGTLSVSGTGIVGTVPAVNVSELSGTSHTFTGVTFRADGTTPDVEISFSDCVTQIRPQPYSACNSYPTAPTVTVSGYSGDCATVFNGVYNYQSHINGSPFYSHSSAYGNALIGHFGNGIWVLAYSNSILAYSQGVSGTVPCTGWVANPVDDLGLGCLIAPTVSGGCDQTAITPTTAINSISIADVSGCNNPGNTPTASDDYFTANVTVNFAYAPGTGNLTLKRGTTVLATKAASDLACVTTWTFSTVQMAANGTSIVLTATFDDGTTFTSNSLGTAPAPCSCVPPTAYSVTGGGAYCTGSAGVAIGLPNSETGVSYQLQFGGSNVGSAVEGTGMALSFGNQTAAGTYTVVATRTAGGCTATMTGGATITANALPIAQTVTGGGAYCTGSTGVAIGLANSEAGVNYQLKKGGDNIGSPVAGTGTSISFNNQTSGTYTVVATRTAGGCTANMTGSATIVVANLNLTGCSNIVVDASSSGCQAAVFVGTPTLADNACASVAALSNSFNNTSNASGNYPVGTTTVVWTATSGNQTATCAITVTVRDNTPPTVSCPLNIIRSNDAGQCGTAVTYTTPTASDNCTVSDLSLVSPSPASGATFLSGTTSVVWKATDGGGLTATCSFTVTVTDSQAPSITCPANIAKGTDPGNCSATVAYANPTYSDNCSGVEVSHVSGGQSGNTFPKGTTTIIWKATDAAGLTKTCSFRIIVSDAQTPTITCPTVSAQNATGGQCSAVVTYNAATATDNCTPAPTVVRTSGPASGSTFLLGNTNVTWRATDGAGRTSTCSFTITVADNQTPTIACPPSTTLNNPANVCNRPVFYDTPTATDNCGVNSVFMTGGMASGSAFPSGVTTVTWRANDANGLSATCSFTVTVNCGSTKPGGGQESANRSTPIDGQNPQSDTWAFSLSPNPTNNTAQIAWPETQPTPTRLTVLDAQGRLVWEQSVPANAQTLSLNVSDWAAGVYFLTLKSGEKATTKRLVVLE